jgi:hypothetical protein
MLNIAQLVDELVNDGTFVDLANSPRVQFGDANRQYLGATILPEKPTTAKQGNIYRENGVQYLTIIANDGTRYSPVQLKEGIRTGSMLVELGHIDVGSEMSAENYDALLETLDQDLPDLARVNLASFFNVTVNLALREKMERMRWEAICDAQVTRTTDMGILDTVVYSNPSGHRVTIPSGSVAVPDGWFDPTLDPLQDIFDAVDFLRDKGLIPSRIFTSNRITSILRKHPKVQARVNNISLVNAGTLVQSQANLSAARLNNIMTQEGLPPIIEYNLTYRQDVGTKRFMRDTAFVIVCETGRSERIDLGDGEDFVTPDDTLGYTAIGRPAGASTSKIVTLAESFQTKPPRVELSGWATTLPVILNPENVFVFNIPYQTP